MSREFAVESYLSEKQLNNQSVSLVIPRLTRDKVHNSLYYKVNLHIASLRGNSLIRLINVIVRDFGTLEGQSVNATHLLGGVEFKCLLMKLIEIKPTIDQVFWLLNHHENLKKSNKNYKNYNDKYVVALLLVYLRIQYYFANDTTLTASCRQLFRRYLSDFRKLKSFDLDTDCWNTSQAILVSIIYMDELVDWLCTKKEIWGISLGYCTWCNMQDDDDLSSENSSDDSDSISSYSSDEESTEAVTQL